MGTLFHMGCGHTAQGVDGNGAPVCVICVGTNPRAREVLVEGPDLRGRLAKCSCGNSRPSDASLAFFEYRGPGSDVAATDCKHCGYHEAAHNPEVKKGHWREQFICDHFEPHGGYDHDIFYCGCRGWD